MSVEVDPIRLEVFMEVPCKPTNHLPWLQANLAGFEWRPYANATGGSLAPPPGFRETEVRNVQGIAQPADFEDFLTGLVGVIQSEQKILQNARILVANASDRTDKDSRASLHHHTVAVLPRAKQLLNVNVLTPLQFSTFEQSLTIDPNGRTVLKTLEDVSDVIPPRSFSFCRIWDNPRAIEIVWRKIRARDTKSAALGARDRLLDHSEILNVNPLRLFFAAGRVRPPQDLSDAVASGALADQILPTLETGPTDIDDLFLQLFGVDRQDGSRQQRRQLNLAVELLSQKRLVHRDGTSVSLNPRQT